MSQSILGDTSNELEIIEFYLDEQLPDGKTYRGHYGVNVAKVLEIIRYPVITGVPSNHHTAVLGTFNLRARPAAHRSGCLARQETGSQRGQ